MTKSPDILYKAELNANSPDVERLANLSATSTRCVYNKVTNEIVWGVGSFIKKFSVNDGGTPSTIRGRSILYCVTNELLELICMFDKTHALCLAYSFSFLFIIADMTSKTNLHCIVSIGYSMFRVCYGIYTRERSSRFIFHNQHKTLYNLFSPDPAVSNVADKQVSHREIFTLCIT